MPGFIPNPEQAVVDERKVRSCLLSPEHAVGRHKAQFFGALGYDQENWHRLQSDLLEHADAQARRVTETEFGRKFEVCSVLTGPDQRSADVVTIWLVPKGEDFARLVTAYPED
ncbi:hypothetical protein IC757_10815 [Wenzhouxiangella sp. AB-CW3]|uniref:DUF6883 domain-containing protein n=1 Tax=Wenzhouxiangella sp. AB-CW3 TaxID=2771012 RepID=UPI00168ABD1C|nr:DUF6883 domain-containing protein [Wenzhouxiangella sp. AB-CW3]QOC21535.1 hypothetical protein IC757_10815 [Wenzhouxiangella sp. AB-CW3]